MANYSCSDLAAIYEEECRQRRKEYEDKIYARLHEVGLGNLVCRKSDGLIGMFRFRFKDEPYPCFWPLRGDFNDPQPCDRYIESKFEAVNV